MSAGGSAWTEATRQLALSEAHAQAAQSAQAKAANYFAAADSQIERDERDRRELFVGVTRARDGVWVGCIAAQGSAA